MSVLRISELSVIYNVYKLSADVDEVACIVISFPEYLFIDSDVNA